MSSHRLALIAGAVILIAPPCWAQSNGTDTPAASVQQPVPSPPEPAELQACRATGLLALQQRSPAIKDIVVDLDTLSITKADTKVEDTPVRTIVLGDAYLERTKSNKPHRFVCLIGDKGRVLLTFFTQH